MAVYPNSTGTIDGGVFKSKDWSNDQEAVFISFQIITMRSVESPSQL